MTNFATSPYKISSTFLALGIFELTQQQPHLYLFFVLLLVLEQQRLLNAQNFVLLLFKDEYQSEFRLLADSSQLVTDSLILLTNSF